MGVFGKDLRLAVRTLVKNPGFTAIAVLTLGLGIAVNATMFSLVSAFLLRRPAVRDAERVVVVTSVDPTSDFQADATPVSVPNYLAWRNENHVFTDMAAADERRPVSLNSRNQPVALRAAAVSPNYFSVLGVFAQLGRTFQAGEDQPGRDHVVILSYEFWERHFAADATLIGRSIRVNREPYTVIGVLPASFRLLGYTPQLCVPLVLTAADQSPEARKNRSLYLFARLKPDVTLEQARAEILTLARQAEQDFPDTEKKWGAAVRTLPDFLTYDFGIRSALAVMMAVVGFVLMIACANVAGLLLARATGRRKELAVRLALGASRLRIVRQLLTEGLVIAFLGGSMGLVLSYWGINFVRASMTFNDAISAVSISLDRNVLFFAIGATAICVLLCSLLPSLKGSRTDVAANLNDEGRGSSPGRAHTRLRSLLVAGEITMAVFLLIGAGLLFRGIFLIEHQDLGFQADHLLTAGITLDGAQYKDAARQALFVQELIPLLQRIPGSDGVAVASDLPSTGPGSVTFRIRGESDPPTNQDRSTLDSVVTADFFRVAGIPLLRGRTFSELDNAGAQRVVLVNEKFVHRYLPDQEALGKQIRLDVTGPAPEWSEIVGIVSNVKTFSESNADDPEVYESFLQRPVSSFSLMVRATSDPNDLAAGLRSSVTQVDADLPLARLMSMSALIERQRAGNPFLTRVLGVFALLALILAAIGIYGLVAYSVGQRTHEFGIRMAVGGNRQDVLRMVIADGVKLAALGSAVGLAIALPLPRIFGSIFYDLHVRELRLYFIVPTVILVVALLATYVPARRAASVDPSTALREQ
jgi:putative ABC transport system permease protein